MKPVKLFFNICIFFALVKVSVLEEDFQNEDDFILIGFQNYNKDNSKVTCKALFMNLNKKNITKTFSLEASITYLISSSDTTYNKELNCKIDNDIKQNDDFIYYNCEISISNINNIIKIYLREGSENFGGKDVSYNLNSLSNLNLIKCTKEFIYI